MSTVSQTCASGKLPQRKNFLPTVTWRFETWAVPMFFLWSRPASQALSGSIAKIERDSIVKLRHQERSIVPEMSSAYFERWEGRSSTSSLRGPIGKLVQ